MATYYFREITINTEDYKFNNVYDYTENNVKVSAEELAKSIRASMVLAIIDQVREGTDPS